MSSQHKIYVYIYLNPLKPGRYTYGNFISFLYEPFYVGKGKDKRCYNGLKDNFNPFKKNTIKSIKNKKLSVFILKILNNTTEENAFLFEKYLIGIIGRKDLKRGTLTNLTNGGEGVSGWSEEQRKELSNRVSGKNNPMYGKGHLIEGFRNPMKNPEISKKATETRTKNGFKPLPLSKEQRKLNSIRMKENNPMKIPENAKKVAEIIKKKGLLVNGKNGRAKPCIVNFVTYSCIKLAVENSYMSKKKILNRIKNNIEGYSFL